MRHRKIRRFRYRNNRNHQNRLNGEGQLRTSIGGDRPKNNFKSYQSPEKLFEKYSTLGKEALSAGDRILSENYFQHADHFKRIVDSRKNNNDQNGVEKKDLTVAENSKEDNNAASDQPQQTEKKEEN